MSMFDIFSHMMGSALRSSGRWASKTW